MNKIQRYDADSFYEDKEGLLVTYEDHKKAIDPIVNILNRLQYEARCCDSYYVERESLRQAISDARRILTPYEDLLKNITDA